MTSLKWTPPGDARYGDLELHVRKIPGRRSGFLTRYIWWVTRNGIQVMETVEGKTRFLHQGSTQTLHAAKDAAIDEAGRMA